MEKRLQSRGGQYFVGNRVTWADLHFLQMMEHLIGFNKEVVYF